MARALRKSPFVLLALALWILACPASLAKGDDLKALNQRIYKLFEEGKYEDAISLAEKAVKLAKRLRGAEHPDTATSLNTLALLYKAMGQYTKAEPLCLEALRIRQKVLGKEHPDTVTSLNNLAELYQAMGQYAKADRTRIFVERSAERHQIEVFQEPDAPQRVSFSRRANDD